MTIWRKYEPTLGEILADSGTRALMHADGVKRSEIEALLKTIGRARVANADRANRLARLRNASNNRCLDSCPAKNL